MKIAFLSDVHLGCERYSVKRASDFFKQFKKAVEKIIALKADVAIIAGDIFDNIRNYNRVIVTPIYLTFSSI